MKELPVGKIPSRLLEEVLERYPGAKDPRVIIGPRVGEDAAVIDIGPKYLVAKTDPITYATERIGWYVVNINANDVATMGATPKWFLATLFLPEDCSSEDMVREIFADMSRAAQELGVALCGGHTEVTSGLDRPIVVGQMLGEVEKDRLVLKTQARPGDDIILTKGIAIEGTAIIAREKGPELIKTFGQDMVKRAQNFLYEPGISIIREALLAARAARVHAMHDLTEGGLATGVLEMAQIAGLGVAINKDRIRCYPETESLCSHYGLNPLGLIASGSLLIALDPKDTQRVLDALRKEGIQAEAIGSLTEKKKGFRILEDKEAKELPFFQVDEIARLFEAEGKKSSALPR